MKMFDRFFRRPATITTDTPAQNLGREIAVSDPRFGFGHSGFYAQTQYNPDDLIGRQGLTIYSKMRHDEQIKAALQIKKLGAIASGLEVVGDGKLDVQKRFIEFNLNEMEGTVESFLLEVLTALDNGFAVVEPCYENIRYGEFAGKWGWKALKVRRPDQIEFEQDAFGNLTDHGVIQSGKRLPANRFAIYSYQKEHGNLYGTSDLRAAHRSWFVKNSLIKFMTFCMERFGSPIPVAKTQTTLSDADKALLLQALQNIQSRTAFVIPASIDLTFESPSAGAHAAYGPIFSQLDQWISMAILTPSLIGAGGGKHDVGSNARSETEFDTFLWVLEQLRKDLQEFINDRIVKVLLDFNFVIEDGIYAKVQFKELTHDRKIEILGAYNEALKMQTVTKLRSDEVFIRELAGFPPLPNDTESIGTTEAKVAEYEARERRYKAAVFWPRFQSKKKAA